MALLEELLAQSAGIGLLWQGNDSWLIRAQGKLIGFDLDLFNAERISPCTVNLSLLAERLDLLMITHEHEDHFSSQTVQALLKGSCQFLIPKSCEQKASAVGIPKERLRIVKPWDRVDFDGIPIACVRAVHGHIGGAVYGGASLSDCGYRLILAGKTLYQPGDTLLLEEHQTMPPVDILFVSPTEHNTWISNSKRLIDLLSPSYIFPQHHSTYVEAADNKFWSHGYVEELYQALSEEQQKRFVRLSQQEIYHL